MTLLQILIPTRNNPEGLCATLGALACSAEHARIRRIRLHLADASNRPVIFNQQVSRLLVFYDLHYKHFIPEFDVNTQRLGMLKDMSGPVLLLDDDIIVMSSYVGWWETVINRKAKLPVFGVTVDLANERGYPDYCANYRTENLEDNHGFSLLDGSLPATGDACVSSGQVSLFSASIGHGIFDAEELFSTLEHTRALTCYPEVADDAAATILAREHGGRICRGMGGYHLGNPNNNWRQYVDKHSLVEDVVAKVRGYTNGA